MNKAPFFSIIIPTLNEELYLPFLLHSLTLQTCSEFETIVVDANSEDKTLETVKKYTPILPNLSVITTKMRNVSHQRNLGASAARGSFLIFLDADVLVPTDFVKKILRVTRKKKHAFITTWGVADTKRKIDTTLVMIYNLILEIEKALNKPFSPGAYTIICKDCFQKIKFQEKLTHSEDHDFTARVVKSGMDLMILRTPRIVISLRRFRSGGTFSTLSRYALANVYILLNGPITTDLFDYPMGGHVHGKKKEELYKKKLYQYLHAIQRLNKSIYTRLSKWE